MLQLPPFVARGMSWPTYIPLANWFALLKHQVFLAYKFPKDPSIGPRALQCITPPILTVIASTLLLVSLIFRPRYFYLPLFKLFRLLPWLVVLAAIVGFGLVAKPAVWEHKCNIQSFEIRPSNRPQWEKIWKEINPIRKDETLWKYRARMDTELDGWEKRELYEDDLEDWVNLSAQAVAKKNCLDEKLQIFRDSFTSLSQDVQLRVVQAWPAKAIEDSKKRVLMDCEICKPVQRTRFWSMTARKATQSGGS